MLLLNLVHGINNNVINLVNYYYHNEKVKLLGPKTVFNYKSDLYMRQLTFKLKKLKICEEINLFY